MVHSFTPLLTAPLQYRDLTVEVPVDWDDPHRFGSIQIFAREVVAAGQSHTDLPVLLFLQGGPGGMSPRPTSGSWLEAACKTYRVVLLDQRGTGRSSPVTGQILAQFPDSATQADYLACFRADSIIRDAEHLRTTHFDAQPWATLGQSYGGFLTLSYLSTYPHALTHCFITGGVPGIHATAEEVYRQTFHRQETQNKLFWERYPGDIDILNWIADRVEHQPVHLPTGEQLTIQRLQTLGSQFGMSNGIDDLHWLLDTAIHHNLLTPGFLAQVASRTSYWQNPLYMVMQETIYHQGEREGGWAASGELRRRQAYAAHQRPLMLTGEAVFPWMFAEQPELIPFRGAAEALAMRTYWPALYHPEQLALNEVPVAAILYEHDTYVDIELGAKTAEQVGSFQLIRSSKYLHDGLRTSGGEILSLLHESLSLPQ